MAEVAVALLGGQRVPAVVDALAERVAGAVVATTRDDHPRLVGALAAEHELVVGVASTPWPQHADLHAAVGTDQPRYRGVVAWHQLPQLLEALAHAAAPGARAGAHLLVTAPDPGPQATPEELTFLREVAEHVAAQVDDTTRSIAWRGDGRQPTAVDALTSVVTVHGHRDVVEVPVAPGVGTDRRLLRVAEELGARLTTVDLARDTLLEALTAVVSTVAARELPPGPEDAPSEPL